ncbi:MAG: ferredoxin-thioredoxin reductase catalytic domain-containing protein [Dehalococcoidales bacterium]|jgi:ferredoxin-thioredoxin reductase catalytic subunit
MIDKELTDLVNKYGITDSGKRTLRIIKSLERNFEKYGASYCPCKIDKIEDNICQCKEFRETGKCICGLYTSEIE